MTVDKPKISVVVPVYNSEGTLEELIRRLDKVLGGFAEDYEVILVNDGSPDHSWDIIKGLERDNARVRGINLMRNYGQHNALLAGIRQAKFELTVTLDDDLQNPPEEIPKLIDKFQEGYDVVFGKPAREQHRIWRNIASQVSKIVLKRAMGADVARNISSFRVFRTCLRDAFHNYRGPFVSIDVLLTWGTTRFAAIPVQQDQRVIGTSSYTVTKLITHALNMMTGFSVVPLQFASLIGFLLTIFGFGVLLFVIGRYLIQGAVVQGFAFLASIIAIFSGAQLFSLGIVGEYLARMHFRMMNRPAYVIQKQDQTERETC
jgi:glycosyltransferase involved in cell wall biosynthesis